MSNFYFSSTGQLKFTNGASAMSGIQNGLYSSSSSSNSNVESWKLEALENAAYKSAASGSSFSALTDEMKNSAITASGKLSGDQKEAIRNSSANYVKLEAARARLHQITSQKAKTYNYSDDDWVFDMVQDYLNDSNMTSFIPYRHYYGV